MFLDEPTSSLDFSNQLRVWELVRDIAAKGTGAVVCTHDPNHILWFRDTVTALKDGAVLADGPAGVTVGKKLLADLHNRRIEIVAAGDRTMVCPVAADGDGSGGDI
jgi:iron complex transport system ATP-binding protein